MKTYFFSMRSYNMGQALIKRYGIWASARMLKNLGIPIESAVEFLAMKPRVF